MAHHLWVPCCHRPSLIQS